MGSPSPLPYPPPVRPKTPRRVRGPTSKTYRKIAAPSSPRSVDLGGRVVRDPHNDASRFAVHDPPLRVRAAFSRSNRSPTIVISHTRFVTLFPRDAAVAVNAKTARVRFRVYYSSSFPPARFLPIA